MASVSLVRRLVAAGHEARGVASGIFDHVVRCTSFRMHSLFSVRVSFALPCLPWTAYILAGLGLGTHGQPSLRGRPLGRASSPPNKQSDLPQSPPVTMESHRGSGNAPGRGFVACMTFRARATGSCSKQGTTGRPSPIVDSPVERPERFPCVRWQETNRCVSYLARWTSLPCPACSRGSTG